MAIISPNEPGGGGSAMLARSTSSTDTEERFALSRNDFRVWSRASTGRSNVCSTASITFGPPGWQTHVEMSAGVRPWSARKLRTSSPKYFSATVATSARQLDLEPVTADIPAHHLFGVGVEPAAGRQHPRPHGCQCRSLRDDGAGAVTETGWSPPDWRWNSRRVAASTSTVRQRAVPLRDRETPASSHACGLPRRPRRHSRVRTAAPA